MIFKMKTKPPYKVIEKFETMAEACKNVGLCNTQIYKAIRDNETAGGYYWDKEHEKPENRICNKCKQELPFNSEYFGNKKTNRFNLAHECKECVRSGFVKYQKVDVFKMESLNPPVIIAKYESVPEASEKSSTPKSSIYKGINEKRKMNGFYWSKKVIKPTIEKANCRQCKKEKPLNNMFFDLKLANQMQGQVICITCTAENTRSYK